MSVTELRRLSRRLQRALDEHAEPRPLRPVAIDQLPPEIQALLCPRCHRFTSVVGCSRHRLRQTRLALEFD